jgi:hypothetical protein
MFNNLKTNELLVLIKINWDKLIIIEIKQVPIFDKIIWYKT